MIKYYFQLFFLFSFLVICNSQTDPVWSDAGFSDKDSSNFQFNLSTKEIRDYVIKKDNENNSVIIGGYITNIFHEAVDSVKIHLLIDDKLSDSIICEKGLFRLPANEGLKGKLIDIVFIQPDYHIFDTSFICNSTNPVILLINLVPKSKILLKGRVYSGNMPLEGVKVDIKENKMGYQMVTKGCFYDKEDYWNCLYDGMFKQDLTFENPSDSIILSFNKRGMKPLTIAMPVKEYNGDVMEVKMKYTSKLPELPKNNVDLKLAFPFTTTENDWFIDLSYYRNLKIKNFNRVSIGIDANMTLSPIAVSDSTFPGKEEAVSDSSYISGFIGPSVLLWIISPDNRYFSTYMGVTGAISLNGNAFTLQPFIGTRIFLDLNKAISIELRHETYHLDVVNYNFNPYGNAERWTQSEKFNEYILNIGIQIVF